MNQKGPIQFLKHYTPFQSMGHNNRMGLQGKRSFPVTDLQFSCFRAATWPIVKSDRSKCDLKQKVLYFQFSPHFIPLDQFWVQF